MKALRNVCAVGVMSVLCASRSFSAEPLPEYITTAQSLIEQANAKAAGFNDFADAVLIAQNYLRRAEAEYKKNLSWGKLEQKAEPTVHYYADMARIQASIVLSQVGKIDQEKELLKLHGLKKEVQAKIKVFDDKAAAVIALKDELIKRDAVIAELQKTAGEQKKQIENKQSEIVALSGKTTSFTSDLTVKSAALAAAESKITVLEQKLADVTKNLDTATAESHKLRADLTALAAQKGAADSQSQEQIQALKRAQDFTAEVGKLGGVIKAGSENMTVMFVRAAMIKAPKNDTLTADGDAVVARVSALLKNFPEFRVKLKVHGFGQPVKNEDAAATDRIARLIREALVEKGLLEPARVEALGVGSSEPLYAKNNPEGNRRVEITFVKK